MVWYHGTRRQQLMYIKCSYLGYATTRSNARVRNAVKIVHVMYEQHEKRADMDVVYFQKRPSAGSK